MSLGPLWDENKVASYAVVPAIEFENYRDTITTFKIDAVFAFWRKQGWLSAYAEKLIDSSKVSS